MKTTLLTALLAATLGVSGANAAVWVAGEDLFVNETVSGGANELNNPNGAWSYGYRANVADTGLTLFNPANNEHTNNFGTAGANTDFQGWRVNNAPIVPAVVVNVTGSDQATNYGAGPVHSHELLVHPGDTTQTPGFGPFTVVRWTAAAAGTYSVDSAWRKVHATTDGVDVHVAVNGVSVFDLVTSTGASDSRILSLAFGDTVDFVIGPNGNFGSDSTAFNATIAPAPETSHVLLAAIGGLAVVGLARRRWFAAA